MELPSTALLPPAGDAISLLDATARAAKHDLLESTSADAPRQRARHFDDILGQTLAGPLFATWTPNAPVNPVSGATSTSSATTPIDPNARREGRRRSRR